MPHGEYGQGQLRLGVARMITMVIVALLEESVVCGLVTKESHVTLSSGFVHACCSLPGPRSLLETPEPHSLDRETGLPNFFPQTGRVSKSVQSVCSFSKIWNNQVLLEKVKVS